jgi:hypothetical protein
VTVAALSASNGLTSWRIMTTETVIIRRGFRGGPTGFQTLIAFVRGIGNAVRYKQSTDATPGVACAAA